MHFLLISGSPVKGIAILEAPAVASNFTMLPRGRNVKGPKETRCAISKWGYRQILNITARTLA